MKINENRLRQIILEEVSEKLVLAEIRHVVNEMDLNFGGTESSNGLSGSKDLHDSS